MNRILSLNISTCNKMFDCQLCYIDLYFFQNDSGGFYKTITIIMKFNKKVLMIRDRQQFVYFFG